MNRFRRSSNWNIYNNYYIKYDEEDTIEKSIEQGIVIKKLIG